MNILQAFIARSLETSVRARIGLDSDARDAMVRLEGKKIQLNMSDVSIGFSSEEGLPVVQEQPFDSPDLEITGSITSVSQALMSGDSTDAVLKGDESLLSDLSQVFHANMIPEDVVVKGKAAAHAGIAAARSAVEGIKGQIHNLRPTKTETRDLHERVAELEEELARIKDKLNDRGS